MRPPMRRVARPARERGAAAGSRRPRRPCSPASRRSRTRRSMAPEAALGRVLAAPVTAAVSLPPWDNSAMDGFAIRAADVAQATEDAPVRLTVVGESRAGGAPDARVMPETAVRIATGAPVPQGADAVVPVEETTPLDEQGGAGPARPPGAGPGAGRDAGACPGGPRQRDPRARQRRPGRATSSPSPATSSRPPSWRSHPGPASARSPCAAGRSSRSSPRATRCAPRARTWDRPGSRTRTARACVRWCVTRAPCRWTSGSPWTRSRTSRRGCGAASPRRTSSSCRAASRWGRTTSSGSRSTTSGT